jgi:predicted transcriptional regulator
MRIREQHHRFQSLRNETQRAAVRTEIRKLLEERFELRLQRLENEVAELRRRLDEQTARLAEQDRDKNRVVQQELDRLLDGKAWDRGPRMKRPPLAESRPEN